MSTQIKTFRSEHEANEWLSAKGNTVKINHVDVKIAQEAVNTSHYDAQQKHTYSVGDLKNVLLVSVIYEV